MNRSSALSPQLVNGVYIPSALLLVGTFIVKKEWLPYAVALAALLGGLKIFATQTPGMCFIHSQGYMTDVQM